MCGGDLKLSGRMRYPPLHRLERAGPMTKRGRPLRAAVLLTVVGVLSCGDDTTAPPPPPPPAPPDPSRPSTLSISPDAAELNALGQTIQLTATVRDQYGAVMAGAAVGWASGDASVATVDASGLVRAAGDGTATITATSGGASASASITVEQHVSEVTVSPATSLLPAVGDTVRLAATATDANGHAVPGAAFTWGSSDDAVATVDTSGLVRAAGDGTATITATSGEASGSGSVTVARQVSEVTVSPATSLLSAVGDTVRLAATATDANGHAVPGAAFTWGSSDEAVATVDTSGLVRAAGDGTATITATSGEASASASITVEQHVSEVTVSPATSLLPALGDTVRLAATAADANGHAVPGAAFTWGSSDEAVATVDTSGLVRAAGDGTATITATSGGASASASITVEQHVSEVTVSPATSLLPAVGDTVRLAATAADANGHAVPGAAFTWGSSDEAVATVDTSGLVRAAGDGTATITATSGEASGSGSVTVARQVSEVTVSPATSLLSAVGDTVRLAATATDANGHAVPGAAFTWGSSDDAVATVDTSGLVRAAGDGTATITATSGEASASASITVEQHVSEVTVSPATSLLSAVGDTVRLAATATDANGHAVPGAAFTWGSSDDAVATVDTSGLVRAAGDGTATITATSGEASASASITVEQHVSEVTVSPATSLLSAVGDTVRLAATATDANGHAVPGAAFTWGSSDDAVATVDTSGLVRAAGDGTATITATSGEASGSGSVTVTQQVTAVTVSPPAATLPPGDTLRLGATATDANGHAVPGAAFTWGSSDDAVATVDTSGLVRAAEDGTATITATSGKASGSASVTVKQLSERDVLVALYEATGGTAWIHNDNWLTDAPLGDWHGVQVEDGRVAHLNLSANNLTGRIPPELGRLSNLVSLGLDNNGLTGPIAPQLGRLSHLVFLALGGNDLTGPVPPQLGNLSSLASLYIGHNDLTGSIPSSFVQLERLNAFWFDGNAGLCGPGTADFVDWSNGVGDYGGPFCNRAEIPLLETLYEATGGENWTNSNGWLGDGAVEEWYGTQVDSLGFVTALDLSRNGLAGRVPSTLAGLERMTSLSIGGNALEGRLPLSLVALPLREFRYENTDLCTPADESFRAWLSSIASHHGTDVECGALSDREILAVFYHETGGPDWINNANWLSDAPLASWHGVRVEDGRVVRLDLAGNALTGALPAELGSLERLRFLNLDANDLSGSLPAELGQLSHLEWLAAAFNDLTGPIPPELGELSRLGTLSFPLNDLTGPIPPELGRLSGLRTLDLRQNRLTGSIPPRLGDLSNLRALWLPRNSLAGPIPPELGNLEYLRNLILDDNALTGPIPPALGNLSRLEELDATSNHLTGALPPELGRLASLKRLLLGGNALTGALPAELGRLANLELLLLWDNDLTGALPPEFGNLRDLKFLGLANNRLAGPIPPEFGNLRALEQVSFDNNRLTGALPPELGNLRQLQLLDLPNNRLTGGLPPEFGDLTSLQELVLTGNAGMTGPLPSSLTTLRRLDALLAGGTGLCTPADAGFQTWLLGVAKVRVSSCAAAASVYLTQAVQSLEFPVSLVAGEPALLRVFVTASNATGQSIPLVRARFYVEGTEVHVADIEGKSTAIPRDLDEGSLAKSANAEIPAEVVQPGLEMVIEVDPDGTLDADLDVTRRIPEAGRLPVDVRAMPRLDLTMIPFLWSTAPDSAIIDMIEDMAADPENHEMLWDTRTLLPVSALDVNAHEPVVSTSNDTYRLLAETELISVMEGGGGHYMGMMSGGGTGPTGLAYISRRQSFSRPVPLAMAHELGHNFSLSHAPCGNPVGPDPSFPQADGSIGAWGYDFRGGGELVSPGAFDLLAYCGPHWISDYHFSNALGFRLHDEAGGAASMAASTPALLLWGGAAADGDPWLEPAFVVDAPPALPRSGGVYELTGRSAGGSQLFSLSFDMPATADGDGRASFAFALPVRDGWTDLATITLSGPGGDVSLDGTTNRPMAILRDPRTGQVRGILRDGPSAVRAASDRAAPGSLGAGLDVSFSRGIPEAAAWRR